MNKTFCNFREIFWPLLEPEIKRNEKFKVNISDIPDDEVKLRDFYEITKDAYREERERLKTIETKSIVFISSIGIIVSIFSVFSKSLFENSQYNDLLSILTLLIFSVLVLYIIRVGYYSIKALERKGYYKISPKEYLINMFDIKVVIRDYIVNMNHNAITINSKVDMMVMAQEYYKRAIVALLIFITFISINSILSHNKPDDNFNKTNIILQNNVYIYPNNDSVHQKNNNPSLLDTVKK